MIIENDREKRIIVLAAEDSRGGAAQHTYQFHKLINEDGGASTMFVRSKGTFDASVHEVRPSKWRTRVGRLFAAARRVLRYEASASYAFDMDYLANVCVRDYLVDQLKKPDLVWVFQTDGLLNIRDVRTIHRFYGCPIILGMADRAPITGGCHYSFECERYLDRCGCCPLLTPSHENDRSRVVWSRKQHLLKDVPLGIVCGNEASAARARESSLFTGRPVKVLNWMVDEDVYHPMSRATARSVLGLPRERIVIMFAASLLNDRRKGMRELVETLTILRRLLGNEEGHIVDSILVLSVGLMWEMKMPVLPFQHEHRGPFRDKLSMALT